jgi:hypothetical protein
MTGVKGDLDSATIHLRRTEMERDDLQEELREYKYREQQRTHRSPQEFAQLELLVNMMAIELGKYAKFHSAGFTKHVHSFLTDPQKAGRAFQEGLNRYRIPPSNMWELPVALGSTKIMTI